MKQKSPTCYIDIILFINTEARKQKQRNMRFGKKVQLRITTKIVWHPILQTHTIQKYAITTKVSCNYKEVLIAN